MLASGLPFDLACHLALTVNRHPENRFKSGWAVPVYQTPRSHGVALLHVHEGERPEDPTALPPELHASGVTLQQARMIASQMNVQNMRYWHAEKRWAIVTRAIPSRFVEAEQPTTIEPEAVDDSEDGLTEDDFPVSNMLELRGCQPDPTFYFAPAGIGSEEFGPFEEIDLVVRNGSGYRDAVARIKRLVAAIKGCDGVDFDIESIEDDPAGRRYLVVTTDDPSEPFRCLLDTDDREEAEGYRDSCNSNPQGHQTTIAVIEGEEEETDDE